MGRFASILLVAATLVGATALPIASPAWAVTATTAAERAAQLGETEGDFAISPQFALAGFLIQRGEYGEVVNALTDAMGEERYRALTPERAYQVALLYGTSAYRIGEYQRAHDAFVRATAQPRASKDDWGMRLDSAILDGDGADALLAFRRLLDLGEPALQSFGGRQLDRFDRLLGALPNRVEARLLLGREMEREDWTPPYVFNDPSFVRLHYAEALMEAGNLTKAVAVAATITDPTVIGAMQADARFDKLVAANPALRDVHAAAERYLQTARDYVRENPRMLSGRIAVARALDMMSRPAESLPMLDEATRALTHGSRRAEPFDDMDQESILGFWRSSVLISVGRVDEGIGARTAVASCRCSSLDAIQVAKALLEAGRVREAQGWLDGLPNTGLGPDDLMLLAQTRACVAADLGDAAGLQTQLAYLKAHASWNPEAPVNALLCAGKVDDAAAEATRQLADPGGRLDILSALQAYAAEPGTKAYSIKLRLGWSKLAALPSVQAAVGKVGRLRTFDLRRRDVIG